MMLLFPILSFDLFWTFCKMFYKISYIFQYLQSLLLRFRKASYPDSLTGSARILNSFNNLKRSETFPSRNNRLCFVTSDFNKVPKLIDQRVRGTFLQRG